jgi:3-phenylpropionate/cinnamic acid dioxygenase small subunit
MIDPGILAQIDDLQIRYATSLDDRDMKGWLDTFLNVPEAAYICTNIETKKAGHRIAMMLDDCYARIQDRVSFITKVWVGTFQDYQTRHVVQRLHAKAAGESRYQVRSSFMCSYTPEETGRTSLLASGIYDDVVVIGSDGARFLSRTAIMDANVLSHYLVYPL